MLDRIIKIKTMQKNKSIEFQFEEVIKSDELIQIPSDIAELTLDAFLDEGLLKDIPVIGWGVAAVKYGKNVRYKLFTKRMWTLLNEIKDVPAWKRRQEIDKIDSDPKHHTKVGETIISLIDRMDDNHKAKLIGKLFRSYLKAQIDYNMFLRLSSIKLRTFSMDIYSLKKIKNEMNVDELQIENLANQGLLTPKIFNQNTNIEALASIQDDNEITYELNRLSELIIKYVLE